MEPAVRGQEAKTVAVPGQEAAEARTVQKRYNLSWLKQPPQQPQQTAAASTASPDAPAAFVPAEPEPEPEPVPDALQPSVHVKLPVFRTIKNLAASSAPSSSGGPSASAAHMIEVVLNDRLGKKVRVKVNSDDTVLTLKKLAAAQLGSHWDRLIIKKCQQQTR